ncbi:MAG: hypothetical protein PHN57_03855 [Candidatus Omnitrophica bacterium]|nr:hypothetical protein [Candidatus Omnitrophota bacterium]
MTKEEALFEFLKGLRATFNNATAYSKEHPYFIKAAEAFKKKIDDLLVFQDPVKVNFSSDSVYVSGSHIEKDPVFVEIAEIFHLRKMKSLEIKSGIGVDELVYFFGGIALSSRKILRSGGITRIIDMHKTPHLSVEELDYSSLLKELGSEGGDIWIYLFNDAKSRGDAQRVAELADNFERILAKFKVQDILDDAELSKNIKEFFSYIKANQPEKFNMCAKWMLKKVLKDKEINEKYSFEEIKELLKDFNNEIFSETLWEEALGSDDVDSMSLKLFSVLVDKNRHQEIASSLNHKAREVETVIDNEKARKRIKELFSVTQGTYIYEIYRNALAFIFNENKKDRGIFFSSDQLKVNYQSILLNLFADENNKERLAIIAEKIASELEGIVKEGKLEYLTYVFEVAKKRKGQDPSISQIFEDVEKQVYSVIEVMAFEEEKFADFEYIVDMLHKSQKDLSYYLENIFGAGKVNPYVLKLFLKFFPGELPLFRKELDKKATDLDFLSRLSESLEGVDSPLALDILEYIFSVANNIIKVDILRIMQGIEAFDKRFIFSVLSQQDTSLRKEALSVLARDKTLKKEALDKLLLSPNPWGRNNEFILENIEIVEELNLEDAKTQLAALGRRWLVWHWKVRNKARKVLRNFNAGKN